MEQSATKERTMLLKGWSLIQDIPSIDAKADK